MTHRNLCGVKDKYIVLSHNEKHMTIQVLWGFVNCEDRPTRQEGPNPEQELTLIQDSAQWLFAFHFFAYPEYFTAYVLYIISI